jgi:hypothetical protein
MSRLRGESLVKCFSLLREFIEGTPQDDKKGMAILALEQLKRIAAGSTDDPDSPCIDIPLANGIPLGGESCSPCIEIPLANGTPPPDIP